MTTVALATEDELSETVGIKLLSEHPVLVENPPMLLRRNGFGYLRSRMNNWREMASRQIVFVLTDLDRQPCPLVLLNEWLGANRKVPAGLLFRIAEKEVESWLLADHDALGKLLGNKSRFPAQPDTLPDPKQHLLSLAKKAPRAVKEDLVAQQGAIARQGIGYNNRLVDWVQTEWSPQRAATRSPSLSRARSAIARIADKTK